jgi:hypothetical protein
VSSLHLLSHGGDQRVQGHSYEVHVGDGDDQVAAEDDATGEQPVEQVDEGDLRPGRRFGVEESHESPALTGLLGLRRGR